MSFTLPDLPYDYDALSDVIDEETMKIHHDRHHAGYVKKLNAALEGQEDLLQMNIEDLLSNISNVPSEIRQKVINSGGGHANHSLFWEIMSPNGGREPKGDLMSAIEDEFDSFDDFKSEFSDAASSRFGSGWAWLVVDNGDLEVLSTQNQDSPLMEGQTPILGIDVWEHAYYLNYQNKRGDYIENWWNVVNWDKVNELYQAAI